MNTNSHRNQQLPQQHDQYPPSGSSNHIPAALSTEQQQQQQQPYIFPHYPTQQPFLDSPNSRPNKGALKDTQVPDDAPPMYTKDPLPIVPPSLTNYSPAALAPKNPSPAEASAPPAHLQSQIHPRSPQEQQTLQTQYQHPQQSYTPSPSVNSSEQTPLSPQYYPQNRSDSNQQQPQPPAPTSNQQDHLSPHSPAPVSYGSIRPPYHQEPRNRDPRGPHSRAGNDSESSFSSDDESERIAARERRRRRRAIKKCFSGCSCNKICWFLIFLVLVSFWTSPIEKPIKDPCTLMAERRLEPDLETLHLGRPAYKNISVDINQYALGDVTVIEADNWIQDIIQVNAYKTFSHPDIEDVVSLKTYFDSAYEIINLRVDLNSTDPERREHEAKIMKNNCARFDLEIVLPRQSDSIRRLAIKTHKGDIRIRAGGTTVVFDDLQLETTVGDVFFEAGNVRTSTAIRVEKGKIQGTIKTVKQLEATTTTGEIALVVDTQPGLHGALYNELNVTLHSVHSPIDFGLARRYQGRFSLRSGLDRPMFTLSPNYTDVIKISKRTSNSLSGWVWDRSTDLSASLPSVSASSSSGLVHARVFSKPSK
ncbi:hypothetical protein FBU30_002914 [Linnemannia zychae]|nr:hypothetical protein FBU30_002914 [Linnemannia zychae]